MSQPTARDAEMYLSHEMKEAVYQALRLIRKTPEPSSGVRVGQLTYNETVAYDALLPIIAAALATAEAERATLQEAFLAAEREVDAAVEEAGRLRAALERTVGWLERVHKWRYEHSGFMNATSLGDRDYGRQVIADARAALPPSQPPSGAGGQ